MNIDIGWHLNQYKRLRLILKFKFKYIINKKINVKIYNK